MSGLCTLQDAVCPCDPAAHPVVEHRLPAEGRVHENVYSAAGAMPFPDRFGNDAAGYHGRIGR